MTAKQSFGLFGTAVIVTFLAGMIVLLVAGAVREATKPVPGWTASPSPTAQK
jgi:hypothetical protein